MLINREGASLEIDDKIYTIGMPVCGTSESEYEGLYGRIIEVIDGEDKQTENDTIDIACEFYPPDSLVMQAKILERFSQLYGEPKETEDLPLDYVIMAPDMIRTVKRCRIYQIEPPDSEYVFRSFDSIKAKGLSSPPPELYKVVFDDQLETDSLEDIFRIFNLEHPNGYTGRSLSMSDIVELYDEMGSSFHYCDTWGFADIPFAPKASQ